MPDIILAKLAEFGLTADALLVMPVLIVPTVELIKKHMNVKGKWLLLASLASGFAWSLLFFLPAWKAVFAATMIGTVMASGGFQGLKTLLGKVGEDNAPK